MKTPAKRSYVKDAVRQRPDDPFKAVPCKVCFAECRLVAGRWLCEKHGPREEGHA